MCAQIPGKLVGLSKVQVVCFTVQIRSGQIHCSQTSEEDTSKLRKYCNYIDPRDQRHIIYYDFITAHYSIIQGSNSFWLISYSFTVVSGILAKAHEMLRREKEPDTLLAAAAPVSPLVIQLPESRRTDDSRYRDRTGQDSTVQYSNQDARRSPLKSSAVWSWSWSRRLKKLTRTWHTSETHAILDKGKRVYSVTTDARFSWRRHQRHQRHPTRDEKLIVRTRTWWGYFHFSSSFEANVFILSTFYFLLHTDLF